MAGTFSLLPSALKWVEALGVQNIDDFPESRYNIKPSSHIPVIIQMDEDRFIEMHHWQLVYPFSKVDFITRENGAKSFKWKNPREKYKTHPNIKKEILFKGTPYWSKLIQTQRGLVPASGFVEWPDDDLRDLERDKVPHYFELKSGEGFLFPCVWDVRYDDENQPFLSCSTITGEPHGLMKKLPHKKAPILITDLETAERWLDPNLNDEAELSRLLEVTPEDLLVARPLGKSINSYKNDFPEVLNPLSDAEREELNFNWID